MAGSWAGKVAVDTGRPGGYTNTATDLYWGRASDTWVDAGDTAILHRAAGLIPGSCTYLKSTGGVPPPPMPGKVYGC